MGDIGSGEGQGEEEERVVSQEIKPGEFLGGKTVLLVRTTSQDWQKRPFMLLGQISALTVLITILNSTGADLMGDVVEFDHPSSPLLPLLTLDVSASVQSNDGHSHWARPFTSTHDAPNSQVISAQDEGAERSGDHARLSMQTLSGS